MAAQVASAGGSVLVIDKGKHYTQQEMETKDELTHLCDAQGLQCYKSVNLLAPSALGGGRNVYKMHTEIQFLFLFLLLFRSRYECGLVYFSGGKSMTVIILYTHPCFSLLNLCWMIGPRNPMISLIRRR